MTVKTFHPRISVKLHKVIGRTTVGSTPASERFQGTSRTIDLTPFLGESGSVRTSKSVRAPAGAFTVTLADRMFQQGESGVAQMDSLYGLIEPMDVVEIRMAHEPHKYIYSGFPDKLPIVMRGFVSSVQRTEGIGADGKPVRAVTISGQDYGKILQIMRIIYFRNYVVGQNLLTNYRLFVNYDVGFTPNQPASDFVASIINSVVNPYLQEMASRSGTTNDGQSISAVKQMAVDASVTNGTISPYGANAYQGGTIHEILSYFGDVGPFNELFVQDREDDDGGVTLVYRPNPFLDVDGNWIQGNPPSVSVITVHDDDVTGLSASRTDANIANYYWVNAARYQLSSPETLKLTASVGDEPSFFLSDYPNSSPHLYGIRKMEVDTQQLATDAAAEDSDDQMRDKGVSWLDERRQVLIAQNRDNVLFESGNIQMRGNEAITPGNIVRLRRREFTADYYAIAVEHNYAPFRSFTTTVQYERGRGFIERVAEVRSPYLAEINAGGVYEDG